MQRPHRVLLRLRVLLEADLDGGEASVLFPKPLHQALFGLFHRGRVGIDVEPVDPRRARLRPDHRPKPPFRQHMAQVVLGLRELPGLVDDLEVDHFLRHKHLALEIVAVG